MAKTVLAVDDSPSIRQSVKLSLGFAGYTVVEAGSGAEALNVAAKTKMDVILTDLNMPEMDGIALITKLRARAEYKFTPILMLTTESQQSKKAEGKTAGATGWIIKPFTLEQLVSVVKRICPP